MDEESYSDSAIDVKPINKNCSPNQKTVVIDDNAGSKNNDALNKTDAQSKSDAAFDHDNQVAPLYGGTNVYGLKNYQINYKKKNFFIKTFDINEALFHLVDSLRIKNDCLFEVKEIGNKKNNSIYHFKNNKRKIINKIR